MLHCKSESVTGRPGSSFPSDVAVATYNKTKKKEIHATLAKIYGWLRYDEERTFIYCDVFALSLTEKSPPSKSRMSKTISIQDQ